MDWQDAIKGVAKAAKDTAEGLSRMFLAEVWPLLAPQLLQMAARLQEDVRSGAVEADEKVRAFFKGQAAPTVIEVLRNDDAFDLLCDLAYDALPRAARRRLTRGQVVALCRQYREKLLAALEGAPDPEPRPAAPPKALPPPEGR
jgi:hypothetical protein